MISANKTFFSKQAKTSEISSREVEFGRSGSDGTTYAEKLSATGLTFQQMQDMYDINIWVRICIDRVVSRTVDLTPLIKPVQVETDKDGKLTDEIKNGIEKLASLLTRPNSVNQSFTDIKKEVFLDILKFDAGVFEFIKNTKHPSGIEIYTVPGNTVKINKGKDGLFKSRKNAYVQLDPDSQKVLTTWPIERICYLMQHPQSHKIYGNSPLETLSSTVTSDLLAEAFNQDFFSNNATPRFAVLYEGLGKSQSDPTINRFRKWWMQELKGKHHLPIILTTEGAGKISFEKVGMSNEEMQFQQYSKWLLQKIMAIFGIQPLILGLIDENMGKLNSVEQVRLFKSNAVKPLLNNWAEKFNYSIVWAEQALNLTTVYLDYDLDLIDKKDQAEWQEKYTRMGVLTINEIRVKGLGLAPAPWGDVPLLQNNITPFGTEGGTVPLSPESQIFQAPEETTYTPNSIVSREMVPNKIVSAIIAEENLTRKQWAACVMYKGASPVGWESMEENQRLGIVEKLIMQKQDYLRKAYSIPEHQNGGV